MQKNNFETIVAQATPPGRGGIGIIRISGSKVKEVAENVLGKLPKPRVAEYQCFLDHEGTVIDQGIALYFPAPHSFTGEDVLELQGHGGPIVLDCLIRRVLNLGVRLARPGEFSERAFLNNKLDLVQAEAVADLIDASSQQAARFALQSLRGEFSKLIDDLCNSLIHSRMYVEAAIDFPEEEIDFLSNEKVSEQLDEVLRKLELILISTKQGVLLREGMKVVIAGLPNAGKSSLLNALCGEDVAIVTDIPGTTRDVLKQHIHIDGLPLHIVDTAGLCETDDIVEQKGIERALKEIEEADQILLVVDSSITEPLDLKIFNSKKLTIVRNKIDLLKEQPSIKNEVFITISLSAKTREGLELLKSHLKTCVGFSSTTESHFIARRRHLDALIKTKNHLLEGQRQFQQFHAGEILAEELRQAHNALSEITGEFRSDDLLGKIFSSFCVGK